MASEDGHRDSRLQLQDTSLTLSMWRDLALHAAHGSLHKPGICQQKSICWQESQGGRTHLRRVASLVLVLARGHLGVLLRRVLLVVVARRRHLLQEQHHNSGHRAACINIGWHISAVLRHADDQRTTFLQLHCSAETKGTVRSMVSGS